VHAFSLPDRQTWGRGAEIDLAQAVVRLHYNDDLLRRSFHPGGTNYLPTEIKSGHSLPEWLENRATNQARPVLACNALHTNFVRGNGFLILAGRLICKPHGTIPLDGDRPLQLNGVYTCLWLAPGPLQVRRLALRQGALIDEQGCKMALSGPQIVHLGQNIAAEIPVRLPAQGPTQCDEVNFLADGEAWRTSWTAFGVTRTSRLLAVSVFAGSPRRTPGQLAQILFQPGPGDGLTLKEMADLMIHLGAEEAILGGGSGDTQQIAGAGAAWCALSRAQTDRVQVRDPLRGLGAILAIYSCLPPNDLTG
jgi:hypothetical protein